jgi:hypothetical protein
MKEKLKILKKIWILNFLRRTFDATKYVNKKYRQIFVWGIKSREDTNFTYDLTEENSIGLAQTISLVTQKDYKLIIHYINEAKNDTFLKESIVNGIKKSSFKHLADLEILFGRRLGWYAFVRAVKPKITIETGVDKGMGSVLLCAAILKNKEEGYEGKYFGTDINPNAGYLLTGKYKEVGEILYGDSIKSLSTFNDPIDLFINDSDHSGEYEYREYITIKNKLSNDAIVLGDNSHITDKLSIFSAETNRNYIYFHEHPLNHWYPGCGIGISFGKSAS